MSSWVDYIDRVVRAVRPNSRKGMGPSHWFPPATTVDVMKLSPNSCYYCGKVDRFKRVHTDPPCPGLL